jgi:hypothetical protein
VCSSSRHASITRLSGGFIATSQHSRFPSRWWLLDVATHGVQVFAFMGDFSNSVKWDPGVKSSVRDQQGPIEVGSSFSLVTVFKGSESQME